MNPSFDTSGAGKSPVPSVLANFIMDQRPVNMGSFILLPNKVPHRRFVSSYYPQGILKYQVVIRALNLIKPLIYMFLYAPYLWQYDGSLG